MHKNGSGKGRVKLNQKFIRHRLVELDESVHSIAETSSLGQATWSRLVNKDVNWTSETLYQLSHDLQCSPADLIIAECLEPAPAGESVST